MENVEPRKIFKEEFVKFIKSFDNFNIIEGLNYVITNSHIKTALHKNERIMWDFCCVIKSNYTQLLPTSEEIFNRLTFLFENPTVEEIGEEKMNPNIARVDIFFKICDLFSGYKVVFDDVKAEFTINTPNSTLSIQNNFPQVIDFCAGLSNVPGCKDKTKYTHLMNDLAMYFQASGEPTEEKKQEGTKITFLIIKQDREKLANDIADTTKTLLMMEDKTSWMYKQNEKLLTYFKAKYEVVDAQYKANK